MSTNVMMPQMGESIAEGTIVRWIKKVGDAIDKDEPLFEISTDKVDAEIPSPGAGVLLEIKVREGETVPVNSVVAVIGGAGEKAAAAPAAAAPPPPTASSAPDGSAAPPPEAGVRPGSDRGQTGVKPGSDQGQTTATRPVPQPEPTAPTLAELRRQRSSPLVRRIAKEHGIDITELNGSGISGRVTKKDILAYVESGSPRAARGAPTPAARTFEAPPAFKPGEDVRIEKMSVIRKKIAEHMVMSVHTSPHVYSAYEVDFSRVEKLRLAKKAEYEAAGVKLTYTTFIAKATVDTIRQFPFSNASLDGDNVVYKRDINLGIAVALESGLIVPVIRNADERSMLGLSRAIQDLAH
ncbi:MAG: dihydrolipoamide acetyltransferase family protein, partial [Acidobacteriota bacterium]